VADDNKLQFDIELNEGSIESSFKAIDERAAKSAKSSAAVFGEHFQKQEQDLKDSIARIVEDTKKVATKSARESASVFEEQFKKQDANNKEYIKALEKESKAQAEAQAKAQEGSLQNFFNIPSTFEIKSITDIASGYFLVTQAFTALKNAAQAAINVVIDGEKEIKLDRKFEALATQAQVVSSVLREELASATRGLVDESTLLQFASETFVQLGNNAKALPAILEVARKSYIAFGGDVIQNAEKITAAIFSGQTRQIRSLGLLIDTDRVYKEYAKSIGTVVPLLTEQQKQTALLNAVLEKSKVAYKNINAEGGKAEEATQRLGVAFKDLYDGVSILVSNGFSQWIADSTKETTKAVGTFNEFLKLANSAPQSLERAKTGLSLLTKQLEDDQRRLKNVDWLQRVFGEEKDIQERITKTKAAISNFQKQVAESEKKAAKDAADAAKAAANDPANDPTKSEEYIRRKKDLAMKVQELNNQVRASEVQLAQEEFGRRQNSANLENLYYQQKLQAAESYVQQKSQLEKFYSENGVNDENLRRQGREALEQEHLNRMLQLQTNYTEQKKNIFYEGETQAISISEAFNESLIGMQEQAKQTSISASKSFRAMGNSMLISVGQASANAFAAFGQAIAQGENALQAFGKALLNSLGQMAIQMGSMFILQGIAYSFAGLANGPPLIAAGAALAVIGGVLSASGGAGPRDVSGGGGTAGGGIGSVADNPSENNPINRAIAPEDTTPQTPRTAINLTINGNVLDRRETGLEIAKILEEQFADQGLVIRGA
jgi:hypothetical protein